MIILLACTFAFSISFAEIYHAVSLHVKPMWLAAASVNTFLIVLYLLLSLKLSFLRDAFHLSEGEVIGRRIPLKVALMPSLIILIGAIGLSLVTGGFSLDNGNEISTTSIYWVVWIPVIEELVFRVGVGNLFRKFGGVIWGSYFSVFIFSFVHTNPTLENLMAGQIGLALGPLLLGAVCEYLYLTSRSIVPSVAFHAVCNATPIVFEMFDRRWLEWLGSLYS